MLGAIDRHQIPELSYQRNQEKKKAASGRLFCA